MAAAALDRALALNPNAAHAWLAGGSIHALRNEPAEAIEAIERARRLSPFDPCTFLYASNIAAAHLAARRFEQAIEWADRALHDQPRHVPAMRVKVVVLAHLGHLDEARAELSRAASLYGLPLSEVDRPCCDSADPLTWMVGWLWSVANIIAARFECVATFSTRGSFSTTRCIKSLSKSTRVNSAWNSPRAGTAQFLTGRSPQLVAEGVLSGLRVGAPAFSPWRRHAEQKFADSLLAETRFEPLVPGHNAVLG